MLWDQAVLAFGVTDLRGAGGEPAGIHSRYFLARAFTSAAFTSPVAVAIHVAVGHRDPMELGWILYSAVPNLVCAGLAYACARIVYGLGTQVKQARELGAYRLVDQLGEGGMGVVYTAEHVEIEKKVALLDPRELGLQIHVLLSVSMNQHTAGNRKKFEDHVQGLPEVMEAYSVSGDRDYVLLIISRDMESYNQFLNTQILDHPSVHSASSSFALRRVKYTTALPL